MSYLIIYAEPTTLLRGNRCTYPEYHVTHLCLTYSAKPYHTTCTVTIPLYIIFLSLHTLLFSITPRTSFLHLYNIFFYSPFISFPPPIGLSSYSFLLLPTSSFHPPDSPHHTLLILTISPPPIPSDNCTFPFDLFANILFSCLPDIWPPAGTPLPANKHHSAPTFSLASR